MGFFDFLRRRPKYLYLKNEVEVLEEYIENNADKISNKTNFEAIPFKECDYVELIVEKEKYSKYGLRKGDRGIIASNKATKNKILVDFGKETEDFDGFISVDFNDIKKV